MFMKHNEAILPPWDGVEEKADLVSTKNNQFVKFKWLDGDDDCYFEIRIAVDELTKDVSLMMES